MRAGARLAVTVVFALAAAPRPGVAQASGPESWVQPELRLDGLGGRVPSVQGALAVSIPFGIYARGAVALGAGGAWHDGNAGLGSRLDGTIRFLLDPFRQQRVALYGLAGGSLRHDAWDGWRPYLVVGLGLEGPEWHRAIPAAELGLGGGIRLGLAVRRAIPERR